MAFKGKAHPLTLCLLSSEWKKVQRDKEGVPTGNRESKNRELQVSRFTLIALPLLWFNRGSLCMRFRSYSGHKDGRMTQRYAHLASGESEECRLGPGQKEKDFSTNLAQSGY